MKLEEQVCSLELAKKLKSLGVKQESLFWYTYAPKDKQDGEWIHVLTSKRNNMLEETISAFTVAELGQRLIIGTNTMWDGQRHKVTFGDEHNAWSVREATEADARAKMLIYLLENKLITA